jgi:hypothetical protein
MNDRETPSWRPLVLGAALSALVGFAALAAGGDADGLRWAARWTGRLGLVLFVPVFLDSPKVWPRAMLTFGASHLVHFIWLASFIATSGIAPVPSRAAGGALAYLLIVALMFVAIRVLRDGPGVLEGPARWLRRVGEPYLLIVFAMTYVARIRDPESLQIEPSVLHVILLGVVGSLIPLRFALEWARSRRSARV